MPRICSRSEALSTEIEPATFGYVPKKKTPKSVRFDPEQERRISLLAKQMADASVGAGQGRLPIIPESDRPYFFREDWLRARGWTPEKPERLVCVKLGPNSIADSMYPTIQPESVLVVDRDPDRSRIEPRSIWLVDLPGEGMLVKRVTVADGVVILESPGHPTSSRRSRRSFRDGPRASSRCS